MELNKEYKKNGYTLRYIKNEGDIYLYEKQSDREYWMSEEPRVHYEVIKAITRKASPKSEVKKKVYPSDSDWGKLGWTLLTRERAEEKFELLALEYKNGVTE